jgi:hypothetical protein
MSAFLLPSTSNVWTETAVGYSSGRRLQFLMPMVVDAKAG